MTPEQFAMLKERYQADYGVALQGAAYWEAFCLDGRTDRAMVSRAMDLLLEEYQDKKRAGRLAGRQDLPTLADLRERYFGLLHRQRDEVEAQRGRNRSCFCRNIGWIYVAQTLRGDIVDLVNVPPPDGENIYFVLCPCPCDAGKRVAPWSNDWPRPLLNRIMQCGMPMELPPSWPKYPESARQFYAARNIPAPELGGDAVLRIYLNRWLKREPSM